MGKLRLEPKIKPLLTETEYSETLSILKGAESASADNLVFYDLDPDEKSRDVRKALAYVAEKEGINLKVRGRRGSNSLSLNFGKSAKPQAGRMSAVNAREVIVQTLAATKAPLSKSQIVEATEISPSTWNLRIKELLADGKVKREGRGRETKYSV